MVLKLFDKINKYTVLVFLVITGFFISRISILTLPFYWDEAWVYGPAVRILAERGPSLLPGTLPVEYARGHPLLFHFLNAMWIKITGDSFFSMHLFNLIIACFLLFSVYVFGKHLLSAAAGFWSVLILCLQQVFIAQSTLVLPEVMLSLFCLLAIYHFLRGKWIYYSVFAGAAVLTKETGIVVIMTVCIFITIRHIRNRQLFTRVSLLNIFRSIAPLSLLLLFILLQYKLYGWVIFPDHAGYIVQDFSTFYNRLVEGYSASLFIYDGRNFLFFTAFGVLILLLALRKSVQFTETLYFLLLFIFLFLIVSSLNFFSNRYILCLVPIFILLTTGIIVQAAEWKKYMILLFPAYMILQIPFLRVRSNSDNNIGYINAVETNMELVNYMKSNKMQDEKIVAFFITRYLLINPYSGYVSKNEVFRKVTDEYHSGDYYIFSNYDTN